MEKMFGLGFNANTENSETPDTTVEKDKLEQQEPKLRKEVPTDKKIKEADKKSDIKRKFLTGLNPDVKPQTNPLATQQPKPLNLKEKIQIEKDADKDADTSVFESLKSTIEDVKENLLGAVNKGLGNLSDKNSNVSPQYWLNHASEKGKKNVKTFYQIGEEYKLPKNFMNGLFATWLHESSGEPNSASTADTVKGVPQSFGLNQWQKGRLLAMLERHFSYDQRIKNFIARRKKNPSQIVDSDEARSIQRVLNEPNSIRKQMSFVIQEINQNVNGSVSRETSGITKGGLKQFKKLYNNKETSTEEWVSWFTRYYTRPGKQEIQIPARTKTAKSLEFFNMGKRNEK
jgi:tetrahydromethanopterin S-methyltransferase subunit G